MAPDQEIVNKLQIHPGKEQEDKQADEKHSARSKGRLESVLVSSCQGGMAQGAKTPQKVA